MHEKCIEFIVEYCRGTCSTWANCINTSSGFEKGDVEDKKRLLFCLKSVENPDRSKEEIEKEIEGLTAYLEGE